MYAGACRAVTRLNGIRLQGFNIRSQKIGITNRCKRLLELLCPVPQIRTLAPADLSRYLADRTTPERHLDHNTKALSIASTIRCQKKRRPPKSCIRGILYPADGWFILFLRNSQLDCCRLYRNRLRPLSRMVRRNPRSSGRIARAFGDIWIRSYWMCAFSIAETQTSVPLQKTHIHNGIYCARFHMWNALHYRNLHGKSQGAFLDCLCLPAGGCCDSHGIYCLSRKKAATKRDTQQITMFCAQAAISRRIETSSTIAAG